MDSNHLLNEQLILNGDIKSHLSTSMDLPCDVPEKSMVFNFHPIYRLVLFANEWGRHLAVDCQSVKPLLTDRQ